METIIKPITYRQICSDVSDIIQFQSEGVLGIPFARTFVRSSMNIAVLLYVPLPLTPALTHWWSLWAVTL